MPNRLFLLTLVALNFPAFMSAATAHDILLFATAVGDVIRGEVSYFGGGPVAGVRVEITTDDGEVLHRVTTDEKGEFELTATIRTNHHFTAETIDGHRATFTLAAEELPRYLDSRGSSQMTSLPVLRDDEALRRLVREEVAGQLLPLRKQLVAYESKVRMGDIIGGIGYIVGLFGIVLYFKGRSEQS